MWDVEDLALWAAPQDVLSPLELAQGHKVAEYVQVYGQMLTQVVGRTGEQGSVPLVTSRYAAQRMAAVIFDFGRTTGQIRIASERRKAESLTRPGERLEQFSEMECRRKLNNLVLDELETAERFARAAAGLPEAEVVQLHPKRRKA
jgi:hypothetical protein